MTRGSQSRHAAGWLALLVCAALAGCGGSSETRLDLRLTASPQINPNGENQASPTLVRFYDLRSADTFNSLGFFDLFDQDSSKLGADLLGRREIDMRPGTKRELKFIAETGTAWLGVLAGFRTLEGAQWRDVIAVEPGSSRRINVTLDAHSVQLTRPRSRFLGIF